MCMLPKKGHKRGTFGNNRCTLRKLADAKPAYPPIQPRDDADDAGPSQPPFKDKDTGTP